MIDTLRRFAFVSALVVGFVSARSADAGGPVLKCGSGVPVLWPEGGSNVPFNPDRGNLGARPGRHLGNDLVRALHGAQAGRVQRLR